MNRELFCEIIEELDLEHLRQLVRQYLGTDYGPREIAKALADQEEF